ncbi:endosomal/lysosomal potassium channel TMEM175 [Protopterus annectens]|uniref:endosomal/lysosomal potassium channel TMEM175 n=1 Tax=Protopterus annectens TaxID=7888 RepID=UPI001CFB88A2|nr:endosomal/lysosomal potassium channel TMEM175 [Protopterus annectens]
MDNENNRPGEEDVDILEHHVDEDMEKIEITARRPFLRTLALPELGGNTQSAHRLLAYSDAILSIVATIMILPIAHTEIRPDQELQESLHQQLARKIAVYLMSFLIVTVAWAAHVRLFQVIDHLDDTVSLLNLACMMTITFLPYTFSLMASFPEMPFGILFFCVCVIAIGLIQALMVLYGFNNPYLLNHQIQMSENQLFYREHILKIIARGPIMCFFAGLLAFLSVPLAYTVLVLVIFLPHLLKLIKWVKERSRGSVEEQPRSLDLFSFHLNEPLSKERLEGFSDGVYAIVATLLILDICENSVPDPTKVKEKTNNSLLEALSEFGPAFLAYFGSFVTVGLLWFVHHSLFLCVTKSTRLMGLLNTFSLAFVGGLPLAYQLTSEFNVKSRNELKAIQVSCFIIFFASIFQFAIWTAALFEERETLHPSVRYGGKEHAFMFAKLSLYPCVSLVTFFLTCFLSKFSAAFFHLMQIIVPFAFLALRILVAVTMVIIQKITWPSRSGDVVLQDEQDAELPSPSLADD